MITTYTVLKLFRNRQEVEAFSKENNMKLVIYQDQVYNITHFLKYHPGTVIF